MKFLEHFLSSLLVLTLSTAIVGFITGTTLGNAKFLETSATKADLYSQLAKSVPDIAASGSDTPDLVRGALATVLTPTYLQQQGEALIPQLVDHYAKGGPQPQIDLSDLVMRLQQAGYPVPADMATSLAAPKTIAAGSADTQITNLTSQAAAFGWVAPALSLALIILIVLVMRERRLPTLIRAASWTAVTLALSGALFMLLPGLIDSALSNNAELKAIAPAVINLIRTISGALAKDLFIATGILVAIAIILAIVHGWAWLKAKFTKTPKTPPPTTPPNPQAKPGALS